MYLVLCCAVLSHPVVSDSVTPWAVALQTSLFTGFCRQEYWSGLPYIPQGDLPNSGVEPWSPTLQVDSLLSESPGKPNASYLTLSLYNLILRVMVCNQLINS